MVTKRQLFNDDRWYDDRMAPSCTADAVTLFATMPLLNTGAEVNVFAPPTVWAVVVVTNPPVDASAVIGMVFAAMLEPDMVGAVEKVAAPVTVSAPKILVVSDAVPSTIWFEAVMVLPNPMATEFE